MRAPLILLTLVLAARANAWGPIPITVHSPDPAHRAPLPFTVSVPFPRGALQPDTPVELVAGRGAALPVQTRPLVRWPDGSVRWLLVDSAVDLAGPGARLQLKPGRAPAARVALRVDDSADAVAIDTGAIRFRIPKDRFAIVDALRADDGDAPVLGPATAVLDGGGPSGVAEPPRRVQVQERGPLRAQIELEGSYGNGFDYLVRVEAYAGQPVVRVWHTFIDRNPAAYVPIARIAVELPLGDMRPMQYAVGIDGHRPTTGRLGKGGLQLVQPDNAAYAAGGTQTAGHLAGWIELDGARARFGLSARWFWQQYPQSLSAQADRIVYNLWAPEAAPAKSGVGAAKTHEFALWVMPAQRAAAGMGALLRTPVIATVDPSWIAATHALPLAVAPRAGDRFIPRVAEAAHRYLQRNTIEEWDDCGAVRCESGGMERRRVGAFGMWNWGDWNFRGYHDTTKGTDSWGNLEYDTAFVLALTAAGSGDAALYDAMAAATRHFIDVDTIHAAPERPEWVGMNHPKNPLHFSFELGGPDLGHTWVQGSLAYYYLTGDPRGLDAARGIGQYLIARAASFERGNPRQWGWPQIALLALFDATGETQYRDAALQYARGGMRAHRPTASTQWKLGILADALAYVHAATGDPAAKEWLLQYAAAAGQRNSRVDVRAFPAVAYVAALTGDPAMRAAAHARLEQLDLGNWGKPFSINGRIGFRIESLLAQPVRSVPTPARHRH
jgi:hypothetical protein